MSSGVRVPSGFAVHTDFSRLHQGKVWCFRLPSHQITTPYHSFVNLRPKFLLASPPKRKRACYGVDNSKFIKLVTWLVEEAVPVAAAIDLRL